MALYEKKMAAELPLGSYPREPSDPDQLEMAVYGRALDQLEVENKRLLEGLASPGFADDWMLLRYEASYQIVPLTSATLADRRSAVISGMGMQRNLAVSSFQQIANGFLSYFPFVKTSPHPFHCGRSAFDSGHKIVNDWIKFAFWIELDAAQTTKPYDDVALIAALKAAAPAEVIHVWTYWSDEAFVWNAYNPV